MHLANIRPRASRRAFLATAAASTVLSGSLVHPNSARADNDDGGSPNPIPSGVAPFAPFGIFIHHHPLNPAIPLSSIGDPSQITDFNGLVGLTHIRGGGTATNTTTGAVAPMAYQADMGFSQGEFIGTDGHRHEGTFAFV
jgi:hypothetical protein